MSKSLRRHRIVDSDEFRSHKAKVLKKREMERKMVRQKNDDYLDDEDMSRYVNDPMFYRVMREYI